MPLQQLENLELMIYYMEKHNESPIALRFPKASCFREELGSVEVLSSDMEVLASGERGPVIKDLGYEDEKGKKSDLGIVSIGAMWDRALLLQEGLEKELGIQARSIGLRWIRPLDLASLQEALYSVKHFIIIEDSYLHSSAAAYLLQSIEPNLAARHLHTFAFPTRPIEHGSREDILEVYGISASAILRFLKDHPLYQMNLSKKTVSPLE